MMLQRNIPACSAINAVHQLPCDSRDVVTWLVVVVQVAGDVARSRKVEDVGFPEEFVQHAQVRGVEPYLIVERTDGDAAACAVLSEDSGYALQEPYVLFSEHGGRDAVGMLNAPEAAQPCLGVVGAVGDGLVEHAILHLIGIGMVNDGLFYERLLQHVVLHAAREKQVQKSAGKGGIQEGGEVVRMEADGSPEACHARRRAEQVAGMRLGLPKQIGIHHEQCVVDAVSAGVDEPDVAFHSAERLAVPVVVVAAVVPSDVPLPVVSPPVLRAGIAEDEGVVVLARVPACKVLGADVPHVERRMRGVVLEVTLVVPDDLEGVQGHIAGNDAKHRQRKDEQPHEETAEVGVVWCHTFRTGNR